jgi:hypothetical protein
MGRGRFNLHYYLMAHVLACKRYPVAKLNKPGHPPQIPPKYIEALEQNQKIAHCCRHPENHEIEAFYSNEAERWRGKDPDKDFPNPPDIYIFHCQCGRKHRRFCVGGGDVRPVWEVS